MPSVRCWRTVAFCATTSHFFPAAAQVQVALSGPVPKRTRVMDCFRSFECHMPNAEELGVGAGGNVDRRARSASSAVQHGGALPSNV